MSNRREMVTKHGSKLDVDVLAVGHHGSRTSSTQSFLNKVTPKYAVIQVGKNSYGHPTDEVLQRLDNAGADIYRNDKQGTIVFRTDGQTMDVNTNAWVYKAPSAAPEKNEAVKKPSGDQNIQSLSVDASIDNPTPAQYSSVTVTVFVKNQNGDPVSGANVNLTLHYKSKDTEYTGLTDGKAALTFKIGRAAKGFTVDGDITVSVNGLTGGASTAFTPH